jgi:hypothetical protein
MLSANLKYLADIVVFICYFVWYPHRTVWPTTFLWWAWVPFVVHFGLHHFFDGLQNTTRNIARIYLIQNRGPRYDSRLVEPIQHVLIPDSLHPVTILWQLANVTSFALLLFFQGWGTVLVAELGLLLFGGGFPIPLGYQAHLRRLHKQAESLDSTTSFRLLMAGIYPDRLSALIGQAIEEKRNPQRWWGLVLRDALEEEVTNNRIESDK